MMGVLLRLLSAGLHGGFHITSVTMVTTGTGTNGNFRSLKCHHFVVGFGAYSVLPITRPAGSSNRFLTVALGKRKEREGSINRRFH